MGEDKHHVKRSLKFLEVVAAGCVAGKPSIALRKRATLYNIITYNQYVGWLAVTVGNIKFRDVQSETLKPCSINIFKQRNKAAKHYKCFADKSDTACPICL